MYKADTLEQDRRTRVFISYSRNDEKFAEQLRNALLARGYEAYLDQHDILPGEAWQERLSGLIGSADTVVFCLSPSFITSQMCDWEINEAERIGKRLRPVVAVETPTGDVPQRLKRLNYIFMRDSEEFAEGLETLTLALETNIDWIRKHTRLSERATEWLHANRSDAQLLRGDNISQAESLLATRPANAPEITEHVATFVASSREFQIASDKRARRRTQFIAASGVMAAAVMAWLGWLMYGQWQDGLIREAKTLSDLSQQQSAGGDPITGALLALEGLPDQAAGSGAVRRLRPWVAEAEFSLNRANRPFIWRDRVLHGHTAALTTARFSPDERNVLTASWDGTARIYDAATGKTSTVFDKHTAVIRSAVFSPDGTRVLTASDDQSARIWDVRSGDEVSALTGHEDAVVFAIFSTDGRRVLTASRDNTARLWNAETGQVVTEFQGHVDNVKTARFSPDEKTVLTASGDGSARLWNAATGAQIAQFGKASEDGGSGEVIDAKYSPAGTHALVISYAAEIWDIATGKRVTATSRHRGNVTTAVFSPDGEKVLTASIDSTVRIWDRAVKSQTSDFRGHTGDVAGAVYSPDGSLVLSFSGDGTAQLWDPDDTESPIVFRSHEDGVVAAAFSSDGNSIVTASADNTARIWTQSFDVDSEVLRGHGDDVLSASYSPDGRWILTGSLDKTVRLWRAATGKLERTFSGHGRKVTDVIFSPDGKRALSASHDGTVRTWDVATGRELGKRTISKAKLNSIRLSPDGSLVLAARGEGGDDEVYVAHLWRRSTGAPVHTLRGHENVVTSAAFSPDGQQILTTSKDGTARLWSTDTGEQIKSFKPSRRSKGKGRRIFHASFSSDGARIVTASADFTARIWDVASEREITTLVGHDDMVLNATFSSDDKRILTASRDDTARLWDIASGKQIAVFEGHQHIVSQAKFSPDEKHILTASHSKTARVWPNLKVQDRIDAAKERVDRCLTARQRLRFRLAPQAPRWCYELKKWPYQDSLEQMPGTPGLGEHVLSSLGELIARLR